jgi:hypothetical protein
MGARWIEGNKDDVVVVDDTHFPVIVATWVGAPTERAVRGYYAWLDGMLARALRDQCPIVNITDSGQAGIPSAEVRRLIADLTKAWELAGGDRVKITAFVVVESAVIRGVLNALGWLHGNLKTTQFDTCEHALEAAIEVLRRAGKPAPPLLVPARWRRPGRTPRSR